ncbi:MAG: hypothetical protein ACKVQB_05305, partial [Bacteroidia bacterium]
MKKNYTLPFIFLASLFMVKCQKEVKPNNAAIKVNSVNGDQRCVYIYPSANDGVIVLNSTFEGLYNKLTLTKIDEDGNTEWTRLL